VACSSGSNDAAFCYEVSKSILHYFDKFCIVKHRGIVIIQSVHVQTLPPGTYYENRSSRLRHARAAVVAADKPLLWYMSKFSKAVRLVPVSFTSICCVSDALTVLCGFTDF